MSDVFSKRKRSEVMSRIKGRGNKDTELVLASLLRRNRLSGWRRHLNLLGRPDFAFPKYRLAVFVDGCFWHGCPRCYQAPRQNRAFWRNKLQANRRRDRRVTTSLRSAHWHVLRIWECSLARTPARIVSLIRGSLA